jgi:hypothetical protein
VGHGTIDRALVGDHQRATAGVAADPLGDRTHPGDGHDEQQHSQYQPHDSSARVAAARTGWGRSSVVVGVPHDGRPGLRHCVRVILRRNVRGTAADERTQMSRLLLYLPALACPLLMLVCMAGMRRMGSPPDRTEEPQSASTADRIAHLEQELAALRAEQQRTAEALAAAEPAAGRPHADPPAAHAGRSGIVTVRATTGR